MPKKKKAGKTSNTETEGKGGEGKTDNEGGEGESGGSRPSTAAKSRPSTAQSRPTTAGSSKTSGSRSSKGSKKGKKKKKKKKKKKGSDSDSDSSDSSSNSDSSSGGSGSGGSSSGSEDDEESVEKGPTVEELRAAAREEALETIDDLCREYGAVKMYIHHFKGLLEARGITVPTVHLVPVVTKEIFLTNLEWHHEDERDWVLELKKWKNKHLEPAQARLSLLRQREYDKKGKYSAAFGQDKKYETKKIKQWENAILHGISMDKLEAYEREKRKRLAEERRILAARLREEREAQEREELEAAFKIQGLWRKRKARKNIQMMLMDRYEKVYDQGQQAYYYYDKVTCTTKWSPPHIFRLFHVELEGVF